MGKEQSNLEISPEKNLNLVITAYIKAHLDYVASGRNEALKPQLDGAIQNYRDAQYEVLPNEGFVEELVLEIENMKEAPSDPGLNGVVPFTGYTWNIGTKSEKGISIGYVLDYSAEDRSISYYETVTDTLHAERITLPPQQKVRWDLIFHSPIHQLEK